MLGTVEAQVGDELVALGPRQRRLVLGVLAWEANRLVPIDRLVGLVWPESPPRSASHAVRVAVSDLRSRLPVEIETHGTGYLLRCDPMRIDVHRFLALIAQARKTADDRARLEVLDEALGLWRGPVMADVASDRTRDTLASGVEETRLVAVEDRVDALLGLGGHRDVVEELLGLVDAHPTRERLVGQLMLALYRGGRAGPALDVFHRTRAYLAEELGIDPGAELRRLELAILRNDEKLEHRLVEPDAPTLVGRRPELALLTEWQAKALSGRPTVVLLEGAAGIGKSSLLDEFGRGIRVLRGQGVAEEGAPAYWPWRQIFRQWLAETEPTVAAEVLGDSGDRIARIVPEIRRSDVAGEPTAEERFALFDEVTALITRIAAGGLVIVVDDLHWADPASLLLFSHLARGVVGAPLMLVGAFRPYELRQTPRGGETLAEITRLPGASRLELSGLSVDEVGQQLTAELGRPCDPHEVATVAHRTGGNPLFVREIGRLRRTDPKAPITEVPTGARDAIRQYLSVLSPSCRTLLSAASVLSVEIDPVSLAAVSGSSIEDALDALAEAVAASVVLPGFRFAHDLVRDSLMLDLTPVDRARIHLRAAEHFDGLAQIAHHRLAALPLGDPDAAALAASRAAEQALSQFAYEEAARLFDQALAALGRPDGDLLIGKATAQYLSNAIELAQRTSEQAAELARRTGDPIGLARAALVMPEQADPLWLPTIKPWCEQALAELPAEDSVLRSRLLAMRAVIEVTDYAADEAMRTSSAALAMAERLDDPTTLIEALRAHKHAHSGPGGAVVRLELGSRAVALSARAGDAAACWGHLWRYDAFMQLGRVHEAEGELDLCERVATRLNWQLVRWHLSLGRAAIAHGRGRFAEANALLDRASRLAERGNNPHAHAGTEITRAYYTASISTEVGDAVAAITRGFGSSLMARFTLANLYGMIGDLDRAREQFDTWPPIAEAQVQEWYRLSVYGSYAQVGAALGDTTACAEAYERLLPYAALHMTTGSNAVITGGSVHLYLGLAAACCGWTSVAVDHFRAANASNAAAGLAPRVAGGHYQLALLLPRAEALPHAREANAIAARLGMPRLAALAQEPLQ